MQIVRLAGKEWQLLLRNPHGMATLFLMPAAFVLVMSFSLKNTLTARVEMPRAGWVLEDRSAAAAQWMTDWIELHGGVRLESRAQLKRALQKREVAAGVIVQAGLIGADNVPRSDRIEMWLGNWVQPASAARLRTELSLSMLRVHMKVAAAQAGPFASVMLSDGTEEILASRAMPPVRYLYEIESGRTMTAVQQTVPAWLIFGMFFVVIPVAGVLIQERNDGTLTRLTTFGVSSGTMLAGKLAAYTLMNWGQLAFMLFVGRWVVPWLGGDALHLDVPVAWLTLMVVVTSAAAVCLALAVAAVSRTFDHAAALGGGLNVLLGAIAGVMVPRMLMPPALQRVSEWSPMGWALDGMQAVFLGEPSADHVLPRAALLACFALASFLLSWWLVARQARVT